MSPLDLAWRSGNSAWRKGHGQVDYLLFVGGQPAGVIEAKPEGTTLVEVEHQSGKYVDGLPDWMKPPVYPLPYMRGVEEEATAEAAGGDIEAAASHAYRRHLAAAVGRLDGIGSGALRSAVALIVIGGAAGSATFGITGPLNLVAGTALGSAAGVIVDVRKILRQRRSRGSVAVHQRIDGLRM